MNIPAAVQELVRQLNNAGYEAYPVGGCVRDLLRGVTPHDWDITTSATPDEMCAVFADERVIPTGLKHGTLTVLKNDQPFEITTYRVDGDYSDGRHPDSVRFTRTLSEDLSRRDFTVNAMALDLKNGVVDPFSGQEDLANGVIRCVGDPDKRFDEDALRVLRALRFAAVLDFTIEAKTAAAIRRHVAHLRLVSAERITEEMTKLLCGNSAATVCREFADVLGFLIPEISPLIGLKQHSPFHIHDVFEHTMVSVSAAKPDPVLRWTMLLHDIGKADCFTLDENGIGHFYAHAHHSLRHAKSVLARFCMSNKQTERILQLVKYHDLPLPPEDVMMTKRLHKFGADFLMQLLDVQDADCAAQAPHLLSKRRQEHQAARELIARLTAEGQPYRLSDLAVTGNDLLEAGVPAGPTLGKLLNRLLTAVMEKRLPNDRQALLDAIKKEQE